jgi:hypothetical protein
MAVNRTEGGCRYAPTIFVLLFLAVLIPLVSVDLPPLVDYPNHLARMVILADNGHTPGLARFYDIRWSLLPNLAMDAIVPPLLHVLPLMVAGRVFLALLLAVMAAGMLLLHRALWGRWSLWPCLGLLLLYNRILLWGFVNFLFGLGLAFCAAALWVALKNRHPVLRVVANTVAATLVFFCHIEAQAILFLIVLGLEGGPAWRELRQGAWGAFLGRIVTAAIPFVPAAVIFLSTWQSHAGGAWVLSDMAEKARQLLTVFGNYDINLDLGTSILFLGLFVLLGLTGRLAGAAALGWWLTVTILAYIFVPNVMLTGASADHRIPLAIAMLLVAGTAPKALNRKLGIVIGVAFFVLLVVRLEVIERVWLKGDDIYRDDLATLALLPEGAKLGVADPWSILHDTDVPEVHIPLLAIPLRDAFVPPLFAYAAQQPVRLHGSWQDLEERTKPDRIWAAFVERDKAVRTALSPYIAQYDYILFVYLTPFQVPPDPCLKFLRGSPTFQLFKVTAENGACPVL